MACHAAIYFVVRSLGRSAFRGNAEHRSRKLATEAFCWSRSLYRKVMHRNVNARIVDALIGNARASRYFIVALQVHDDLQLVRNGGGWTMDRLIETTILSFAGHAAADQTLVFKVHPLDRGHRSYRTLISRVANEAGCASKVQVVDEGLIGSMIRHCAGVITVNSTAGLLALAHGKPLLAMGEAVYSNQAFGININTPNASDAIDLFWRNPLIPNENAVASFIDRVKDESLIPGSYYSAGRLTAEAVVRRIEQQLIAADFSEPPMKGARVIDLHSRLPRKAGDAFAPRRGAAHDRTTVE